MVDLVGGEFVGGDLVGGSPPSAGGTDATVAGVLASITLAAPLGTPTGVDTIVGPTGAITITAPPGSVTVTVPGVLATITVTAPVGTAGVANNVLGPASTITPTALPGSIISDGILFGPAAHTTTTAPAGAAVAVAPPVPVRPSLPSRFLPINIPFGSDGWKYHVGAWDPAWISPTFDDSAWLTGKAVIATPGVTGYGVPFTDGASSVAGTSAPVDTITGTATEFTMRRLVGPGTGIVVTYDENNYMFDLYAAGVNLGVRSTGNRGVNHGGIPDQLAPWVLIMHVTAGNGQTWCAGDLMVTGTALAPAVTPGPVRVRFK
jgi:hypothetical protein